MNEWLGVWKSTALFRRAFTELQQSMRQNYRVAERLIRTDDNIPSAYRVRMGAIPDRYYQLRHNLFSTLFQSVYLLLDIDPARRLAYGGINHCFRVWVTGADNLLDNEDKEVIPLQMPHQSRIMQQVISIMAADRMLYVLLEDAAAAGAFTRAQVTALHTRSLQLLLPSAAQEASEEGGVTTRPSPDEVLSTIHKYKTGLLFHLPFLGIEEVEHDLDQPRLERIKAGLMDFGLGCQILDDIRDLSRDLHQHNHNYLLSLLYWEQPDQYAALQAAAAAPDNRTYQALPKAITAPAAALGFRLMRQGLATAFGQQLATGAAGAATIARGMFEVLDLTDLSDACGEPA